MMKYNVVVEIELDADNPLEAAKNFEDWIKNGETRFTYVVQDIQTKEIVTVDLGEDDEDAVLPDPNHKPLIS